MQILEYFVQRWQLEVTFEEVRASVPDTFDFLLSWSEEMFPHAQGVDQQNLPGRQTLPSCLFAANAVPTANPVIGRVQRRAARPMLLDTRICRPGGHVTQVVRH